MCSPRHSHFIPRSHLHVRDLIALGYLVPTFDTHRVLSSKMTLIMPSSTSFVSKSRGQNLRSTKFLTNLHHHLHHTTKFLTNLHHHLRHTTNSPTNHHHPRHTSAPQIPKVRWLTTYNSHLGLCITELHHRPNTTATPTHVNSLCATKPP
jgi:hypothetical protein